MPDPVIMRVDGTPNPHAIKLTLNRVVSEQGKTFRDPATADLPWAKALLEIEGIVGIYGINNFISVNKQPDVAWDALVPQIESALQRAFDPAPR